MTRSVAPGDVGWPRPRLVTTPAPWNLDAVPEVLPVPWVAKVLAGGEAWSPIAYDDNRLVQLADEDRCQVCGGPRGATVYALARALSVRHQARTAVPHAGGSLCSLRCARLTAEVCPHYRKAWPVAIYEVPHPGPRTAISSIHEIDDAIDITSPTARLVDTIGDPA